MINIGYLYARRRCETSYNNYDLQTLKSGIQKYARRNIRDKGLYCLIELDLFRYLESENEYLNKYLSDFLNENQSNTINSVKKIRSNMINRLVVMMSEEINMSCWWLPIKVHQLYLKWQETRTTKESRKYLLELYSYINEQKMIRYISDLKSVYMLPPYYAKESKMDQLKTIHQKIKEKFSDVYNTNSQSLTDWFSFFEMKKFGSEEVNYYFNQLIESINIKSDSAFDWLSQIIELSCFKNFKIIWRLIRKFIEHNNTCFPKEINLVIDALEFFYKKMTHKEKPIYLYHALLLLIHRDKINWDYNMYHLDFNSKYIDKMYERNLNFDTIDIDNFILDIHTKNKKNIKGGKTKFALEGAYVVNENKDLLNKRYRELYIDLKKEIDNYL